MRSLLDRGGMCSAPDKVLPMSEYVRITTKCTRIRMESSGRLASVKAYADAGSVSEDVSFCVSAKGLSAYLAAITDPSIVIEADLEGHRMSLLHSGGKLEMPCADASDFTDFENPPKDASSVRMRAADMTGWMDACRLFAANDELRPVLGGMRLMTEGDIMTACASDGHMLFYDGTRDGESDMDGLNVIIPSAAFGFIQDMVKGEDSFVMKHTADSIWIYAGTSVLSVRLVDGRYPNVKAIIPSADSAVLNAVVDRAMLMESMKRISLMASATSNLARFEFGPELSVTAEDADFARKAEEKLPVRCEGSMTIGFSCKSMMKALSVMEGDTVTFRLYGPDKAALLSEAGGDSLKTVLLMPMRLI